MSGWIFAIASIICGLAFTVGVGLWLKGGYENVRLGFNWIIVASVAVAVALPAGYWYYVVRSETDTIKPNVVFGDCQLREPLAVGKKPWVQLVLVNTTDVPIEGRFFDITWLIVPASFGDQLEYAL